MCFLILVRQHIQNESFCSIVPGSAFAESAEFSMILKTMFWGSHSEVYCDKHA